MPIDLPWALAFVIIAGLIPALKTIPNAPVSSSNSSQNSPSVILSQNSGLTVSDVKLVRFGEGTVIRYSIQGKVKILHCELSKIPPGAAALRSQSLPKVPA